MVCPPCYQDYISKCSTTLTINAGLTADTDYRYRITDKFGIYEGDFSTDGEGLGIIDLSDLPEGLFNPHAGFFQLNVLSTENELQTLSIDETDYTCIEFNVVEGNHTKTYLGEYTEEATSS